MIDRSNWFVGYLIIEPFSHEHFFYYHEPKRCFPPGYGYRISGRIAQVARRPPALQAFRRWKFPNLGCPMHYLRLIPMRHVSNKIISIRPVLTVLSSPFSSTSLPSSCFIICRFSPISYIHFRYSSMTSCLHFLEVFHRILCGHL